jgi:hypothetical protein
MPRGKGPRTGGRKAGTPNRRTADAKALAREIIQDPSYIAKLHARALAGTLPPAIEAMLWYYAYGKPAERLEHTGANGGPLIVEMTSYADPPPP